MNSNKYQQQQEMKYDTTIVFAIVLEHHVNLYTSTVMSLYDIWETS